MTGAPKGRRTPRPIPAAARKSAARKPALRRPAAAPGGPERGAAASPRVAFVTLGCPKNQVDSEVMLGRLHRAGFETTGDPRRADVAVVNTCAFLEAAVSEGIETILGLAALKAGGLRGLVVAGCLSQRYAARILAEIPEVDAVIGTGDVDQIADVCREVLASNGSRRTLVGDPDRSYADPSVRVLSTPRHSPYLQISQGCGAACTFCIIPALRGPARSRPPADVLAEAQRLVRSGARELVIIGQDTTAYGLDRGGRRRLPELLRGFDALEGEGLRWVRLMYTNPLHWDASLVEAFAASRTACAYVDLPIQHASDRILKRMGRGHGRGHLEWLVERLRAAVPGVALRTSVITGFPGETETDFRELLDFLAAARFDRLVVFPWFAEEGTAAARLPGWVAEDVMESRIRRVRILQTRISREKNRELVGHTLDVLVDKAARGRSPAEGRSHREAPEVDGVIRLTGGACVPGRFHKVRITRALAFEMEGTVVGQEASSRRAALV